MTLWRPSSEGIALGYELDLNEEPAQVVPIRPGIKAKPPRKAEPGSVPDLLARGEVGGA